MQLVHLRPARSADAATIHALVRESEVHDREPVVTPIEEIHEIFEDPHLDPMEDLRLAYVGDRPAGWGRVWHHPSGERLERAYLLGTVLPERRGQGVGRALFAWQLERARTVLGAYRHDLPRQVKTAAWDWLIDAQHLYERFGLTAVRWFDELLRPLNPPLELNELDGVDIALWKSDQSEEVRLLHNRAFADHWGSGAVDPAAWAKRLTGYGTRLDLSVIALVGGRVVGYSINEVYPYDEELLGRRDGWIGALGVERDHRSRGIASALIATSMELFRSAGLTHASIGVDADSPTGAHRLYRRLGFQLEKRSVTHQLEL
jgi:GNAT superfamily N-acetyltransferase